MSNRERLLREFDFPPIPNDWEVINLSQILSSERGISVGVMYPGKHDPEGIPLIRAGDLTGNRVENPPEFRISKSVNQEYKRTILEGGELLISLVGDIGRVAVVPEWAKGWNPARAIGVLRISPHAEAKYVRLVLSTGPLQKIMRAWANTTVQATLNLKEIKELPLPWPKKGVRDSIVDIADALENKIELNRQMNRTLEQMARALFKSWFIDFDPVHAKQRGEQPAGMDAETAALFTDRFVEIDGKEVPEGWELKKVQDIVDILYGKALKAENRLIGDIPVYGSNGPIGFHNQALVRGPGIVLGRKGNPGTVIWSHQDFFPIDTAFYIIPKDGFLSLEHIYFTLSHLKLSNLSGDSAVPGLSRDAAYAQPYLIPSSSLAERFKFLVSEYRSTIHANEIESDNLAKIRDSLLPRLLSGELDVSDWENAVEDPEGAPA